ncbi:MAG: TolB family protein [Acidimicrobiales bacterium]
MAIVAVATSLSVVFATSFGGRPPVTPTASAPVPQPAPNEQPARGSGPTVDAAAFKSAGDLAFISGDRLYALDGAASTVRLLPALVGYAPADPAYSSDGRWLSYLQQPLTSRYPPKSPTELWIARANGRDARQVRGPNVDEFGWMGWSPVGDRLAVITDVDGRPNGLRVVSPTGAGRVLFTNPSSPPNWVEDAVWSPEGTSIAVTFNEATEAVIRSYPVAGGPPTTWLSLSRATSLPGTGDEAIPDLAGWWDGWGIGFWVYSNGESHNNDSTPLEVLSSPGARPRLIGQTLSDGMTDAIAAGRGGALAIVSGGSGGRVYGQGKEVEVCDRTTFQCAPIAGADVWVGTVPPLCPAGYPCEPAPSPGTQGSGVSIDPAWSPSGSLMAYVKAPVAPTVGWPLLDWFDAHALYLMNVATGVSTEVGQVNGASMPTWSRTGRELLYASKDGLWLYSVSGGSPTEIADPLFPPIEWTGMAGSISYYGQIDWSGQFSWWSPRPG